MSVKHTLPIQIIFTFYNIFVSLELMCSPRDQRFTGSNPAEVDEFFSGHKNPEQSPPGGTLSRGSRV